MTLGTVIVDQGRHSEPEGRGWRDGTQEGERRTVVYPSGATSEKAGFQAARRTMKGIRLHHREQKVLSVSHPHPTAPPPPCAVTPAGTQARD